MRISAALLAGGKPGDKLAVAAGVPVKVMAPIAGKPMVSYVLEALRGASSVSELALIADEPAYSASGAAASERRIPTQGSFSGNVLAALDAFPEAERVLMVSGDIPFATSEQIEDFIGAAVALDCDFAYPIVDKKDALKLDEHGKHTFVHTKEGTFTGGNLMLVRGTWIRSHRDLVESVLEARKNPVKLGALIGPTIVMQALFGRLSIAGVEKLAQNKLDCHARAIITPHAALGIDIDTPEVLVWAESVLARRSS